MEYASFQPELATRLRGRPTGTTADINKQTVAYWDGSEIRGIHLRHDGSGRLDEVFDSTSARSTNCTQISSRGWTRLVIRYALNL